MERHHRGDRHCVHVAYWPCTEEWIRYAPIKCGELGNICCNRTLRSASIPVMKKEARGGNPETAHWQANETKYQIDSVRCRRRLCVRSPHSCARPDLVQRPYRYPSGNTLRKFR